ncbi:MAG: T9SS type A sorting domain-containing protein, partial [Cytophagales bacterium]|nr:T9SS type A sorting domain-containing protein [Cytophagales bacterium]
ENVQAAVFISSSTGWVGTYQGNLYVTTNSGNSWNLSLNVCNSINDVKRKGNTLLVSGANGNIYRSMDMGQTWVHLMGSQSCLNENYTNTYSMTDSLSYVIGGTSTSGFILRSSNGGRTYPKISFSGKTLRDIEFLNPREGVVVGNAGGIYKTLDSGKTWSPITTTITSNLFYVSYPSTDTLYVASKTDIWFTYDNGSTWTKSTNPLAFGGDNITGMEFLNGKVGFLTSNYASVRKTTDASATWTTARYITSNVSYYGLAFHIPSQQGIVMGSGYNSRTNDLGNTWSGSFSSSYSELDYFTKAQFLTDKIVYAIKSNDVYRSSNSGYNWATETTNYLSSPLSLQVSKSGKAIVVSAVQIMSKKDQGNGIPTFSHDSQDEEKSTAWRVYPNPAKDVIHVENASSDQVFSIFDAMGKEVKSQVYLPVSIADLPTGIYIVRSNAKDSYRFIKE